MTPVPTNAHPCGTGPGPGALHASATAAAATTWCGEPVRTRDAAVALDGTVCPTCAARTTDLPAVLARLQEMRPGGMQ